MDMRRRLVVALGIYLAAVVAFALVAMFLHAIPLVLPALGLAGAFVIAHQTLKGVTSPSWRLVIAEGLIVFGGATFAVWAATGRVPGIGFIGLATMFLGFGELLTTLRPQPNNHPHWQLIASAAILGPATLAFVGGLVLLA